tara:strand:- start:2 stop:139 length:138 start_codon:yes stop_codon:yes gene_type:complete
MPILKILVRSKRKKVATINGEICAKTARFFVDGGVHFFLDFSANE